MLRGDFGESFFFKKQVAELIVEPARADAGARARRPSCSRSRSPCRSACSPPTGTARWIDRLVMGFSVLGFSVPVFVIGYIADLRLRDQARLAAGAGLPAHRRRLRRLPAAADPAGAHAVGDLHRADRAHDAHQRARGAERGLHPHRPRQGPDRAQGAVPPRAAQRRGADRHRDRPRRRAADRRRGRDRERLHASPGSAG